MSRPENLVMAYSIMAVMHDGFPHIQVVFTTMNDERNVLTHVFHIPLTRAALLTLDVDALINAELVRAGL